MTDKQQIESDLIKLRHKLWDWCGYLADAQELPQHAIYSKDECEKMCTAISEEIKALRAKQGKKF
jgi:cob(I)alamin adenosyltransferase